MPPAFPHRSREHFLRRGRQRLRRRLVGRCVRRSGPLATRCRSSCVAGSDSAFSTVARYDGQRAPPPRPDPVTALFFLVLPTRALHPRIVDEAPDTLVTKLRDNEVPEFAHPSLLCQLQSLLQWRLGLLAWSTNSLILNSKHVVEPPLHEFVVVRAGRWPDRQPLARSLSPSASLAPTAAFGGEIGGLEWLLARELAEVGLPAVAASSDAAAEMLQAAGALVVIPLQQELLMRGVQLDVDDQFR